MCGATIADRTGAFHVELMQPRNNIIVKYVDMQSEFELCALEAARKVIKAKGSASDMRRLFDFLLDSNLISEDAFMAWRTLKDRDGTDLSNDEHMKALATFFDFLLKRNKIVNEILWCLSYIGKHNSQLHARS